MTAEELQELRLWANRVIEEDDQREFATAAGQWASKIKSVLDALAEATQRADSLNNTLYEEREQNESLQVALNEKTAEVRILEEKIAVCEHMLYSSLRP